MDKNVFRNLSYGVYVVTTVDKNKNVGCIANSVMQITSNPATIAISINHDNYTNGCIKKNNKFAISILNEKSDSTIIGTFGFKNSKDTNKFENIDYKMVDNLPVINDSCGYITCEIINCVETDTHTVFIGKVISADGYNNKTPMTYKYYHEELKGKSPKNAPTYLEETKKEDNSSKKLNKYVCSICGYVHEARELPDDFKCPICGYGKEYFKKQENV